MFYKQACLVGLLWCLCACGGIQTDPSCKVDKTGQVNFHNDTTYIKRGIHCWLGKDENEAKKNEVLGKKPICSNVFDIPPGYSWVKIKQGYYTLAVKTHTRVNAYNTQVNPCGNVDFRFKPK
jgi:hypothetical protein